MADEPFVDYYEALGVAQDATEKEISSKYRKLSITCHPDRFPDDKVKAALFLKISKAVEILTDEKGREAYDNVLKAKKERELRYAAMDKERKRMKDDLEAREQAAMKRHKSDNWMKEREKNAEDRLAMEMERIRREGLQRGAGPTPIPTPAPAPAPQSAGGSAGPAGSVKVKWSKKRVPGYSESELRVLFERFGKVDAISVSSKAPHRAAVMFRDEVSARRAAAHAWEYEEKDKLTVDLVGNSNPDPSVADDSTKVEKGPVFHPAAVGTAFAGGGSAAAAPPPASTSGPAVSMDSHKDFESVIMMKMRQAAERKKLAQQMKEAEKKE